MHHVCSVMVEALKCTMLACSVWMAGALSCIIFVVIKWLRCSNALYLQCSNCWDAQMYYNCTVWMVETSKSSQRFAKSPRAPEYLCARDIHCTAIIVRNGVLMWNALYLLCLNGRCIECLWQTHIGPGTFLQTVVTLRIVIASANRCHAWVCHDKGESPLQVIAIVIAVSK